MVRGDVTPDIEREVWVIRICACGFPLGAVLAAIALKRCPDCGAPTIPVEDVTRRVTVYADARERPICSLKCCHSAWQQVG
jgi:hypothetical protein